MALNSSSVIRFLVLPSKSEGWLLYSLICVACGAKKGFMGFGRSVAQISE